MASVDLSEGTFERDLFKGTLKGTGGRGAYGEADATRYQIFPSHLTHTHTHPWITIPHIGAGD